MKAKQWRGKQDLGKNLRTRMPQITEEWFSAGEQALQPGRTWEEIHQFRLLTKRFRYTLEIFRPAYGPSLDRRIEKLRELQTLLGNINDAVVSAGLLSTIEGTESTRARLGAKAERLTAKLLKLWSTEFSGPVKCAAWKRYMAQYACRPKPLPRPPEPATPDPATGESAPNPEENVVY